MFVDVLIPRKNEAALVGMALKLGIKSVCFLYPPRSRIKQRKYPIPAYYARLNKSGAALIKRNTEVFFDVRDLSPDLLRSKKLMGFSFSAFANAKNPVAHLRRLRLIIKLCRKSRTGMVIASLATKPYELRSPSDLASLFTCFGMTPGEAKHALNTLSHYFLPDPAITP